MTAYITMEWDAWTFLGIVTFLGIAWIGIEIWAARIEKDDDDD
jgi:hypothetical protein